MTREHMKDTIVPISTVIKKFFEKLGFTPDMFAIYEIWDRELGWLGQHVRIAGLRKGKLLVEADTNAHMQEFHMIKHKVLNRLNEPFGRPVIKQLAIEIA